jgi:hypothetical protein
MNKAEIISKTLNAMNLIPPEHRFEEQDEEAFIISVLQDRLPTDADIDIRTCEDFQHLKVECCTTCHNSYPHYEMKLIMLTDGSPAWVCETMKLALYFEKYRELQQWSHTRQRGSS